MKRRTPQRAGWLGEREGGPLAPLFMFLLPPGPALCNLGLVRSAVLPEVLTLVLGPSFDLLLFYFRGLFPSLSFSHRHFGLLQPILKLHCSKSVRSAGVYYHSLIQLILFNILFKNQFQLNSLQNKDDDHSCVMGLLQIFSETIYTRHLAYSLVQSVIQ